MNAGLMLRRQSLFSKRDGRSVVIAMDHGAIAGPIQGIVHPDKLVSACIRAKVDGILANKGFVDASVQVWDRCTALVLRLTGGFTVLGGQFEEEMIVQPLTALSYGAACAAITVKFGHEHEGTFIRQASLAIDECHRLGLPVMVEAMAKGSRKGEKLPPNDPEAIKMVARMGAEIGADLIKTHYTGSIESFARVTEGCPVPILVLGGEKTDSVRSVFQDIHDSLSAGGKGIAVGRNIWEHGDVDTMLTVAMNLVHENWSVDQACDFIGIA